MTKDKETPAEAANPAGACLSRNTIHLRNLVEIVEKSSEDAPGYGDLFRNRPGRLERDRRRFTTEVALAHASHGIPVHPLRSDGKEPVLEKFHDRATTDPNVIREWWLEGRRYEYCNIGGSTDGYLVIDADAKVRRLDAVMLDFELKYGLERGPLPPTWAYETPSKGNQFWYKMPPGFRAPSSQGRRSHDVLPDDVDFRGWHGNAVLPGSYTTEKHEGGKQVRWDGSYRWKEGCSPDDIPIAEAPIALIEMAWAAGGKSREWGTFQIEDVTGSVSGDGTIVGNDLPPACDLDTEEATALAREWLTGDLNAGAFPYSEFRRWLFPKGQYAPEGEHGFESMKGIIQTLGDMGLSRDGIFEVLTEPEGYNELKTGFNPWAPDDLLDKIVGVLSKREKPLGCGYAPPRYPAEIVFNPVAMTVLAGEVDPDSPDAANLGPKIPLTGDDWRFWAWVNGDDWSKGEKAEGAAEGDGKTKAKRFDLPPYIYRDPSLIPPREWLYDKHYIRKYVSGTVAPGGGGKSSLVLVESIAMATGLPLLGIKPVEQVNVAYWNGEDPYEEIERRVAAIVKFYGLDPRLLEGRFFFGSGRDFGLKIAHMENGSVKIADPVVENVLDFLIGNKIDVLNIDPFISCHSVPENLNDAIDAVAKTWGTIAGRANSSVGLVIHTRKQLNGSTRENTSDDTRGAGALGDAARSVRMLNPMSVTECGGFGIAPEQRGRFFRVGGDGGKVNMTPRGGSAAWYQFESVKLGNAAGKYGEDDVGVVTRAAIVEKQSEVANDEIGAIQRVIAEGEYRGSVQSPAWAGKVVAEVLGLDLEDPADRARAKVLLKKLLADRWLVTRSVKDQKGKSRPIITVGNTISTDED